LKARGGYFYRVLDVDLSTSRIRSSPVSDEFALKYVGGRGWGARFTWDNLRPGISAFHPDNLLTIAPGPLNGLYVPGSGKTSFSCISPATGLYADSNMGGSFGTELRQAGWDALRIRGRAHELSYIWIEDESVEIRSAAHLRGAGATTTETEIKKDLGEDVRVAAIGPAGENGVVFATVNTDWGRNAGRTGMGAVLGSKNLKAIAIRGTKDLPVCDVDRLTSVAERAYSYLNSHTLMGIWHRQGLMSVIDYANTVGFLPTYNFRDAHFDDAEKINGDIMEGEYKIGNSACFACPMCCGNVCLVKSGRWAGYACEGPEYETAAMFGSNLGITDFSFIVAANQKCDELGIDTISSSNLIGVLIEAIEKGMIGPNEAGLDVSWGDEEGIMKLLEMIADRSGVGDILAQGSKGMLSKWPQLSRITLQVKGLEQSAYDSRVSLCMALAYGTCDVGAHHNRAWPISKELEMGKDWGVEEKVDLVLYHQSIRPLFDMLGVCRLPWIELAIDENLYAEMYSAVTGIEHTLQDLLDRSKAIYDLTRSISARLGVRRKDDYAPPRTFEDPIETGPFAGRKADMATYETLLETYYQRRGWDLETGIPKRETLIKDGLEDVAEQLYRELGSLAGVG